MLKLTEVYNYNYSGGGRCKKLGGLSIATGEYTGGRTVREAHSEHAKHALPLGGLGACPPRKFLKKKCCEIEFGGSFSQSQ